MSNEHSTAAQQDVDAATWSGRQISLAGPIRAEDARFTWGGLGRALLAIALGTPKVLWWIVRALWHPIGRALRNEYVVIAIITALITLGWWGVFHYLDWRWVAPVLVTAVIGAAIWPHIQPPPKDSEPNKIFML